VPLAGRFGDEGLLPQVAAFGQVIVSPVNVGFTKKPLQLIAPANRKRAAKEATTRNLPRKLVIAVLKPTIMKIVADRFSCAARLKHPLVPGD
jgi:hypothetical protein